MQALLTVSETDPAWAIIADIGFPKLRQIIMTLRAMPTPRIMSEAPRGAG
jgi:hypothetical protein